MLLFVRETVSTVTGATPFLFLGPAHYVQHRGERPMAITWTLEHKIPAAFYQRAKLATG